MNLKKIIRNKGLKQRWIAEQLGLQESNLSSYLSGNKVIPSDVKMALYNLLGINTEIKIGEKEWKMI